MLYSKLHVIPTPTDLRSEIISALLDNLENILKVVKAEDVGLEYRDRSVVILVKKAGGYNLNELSQYLESILPENTKIPYWG